MAGLMVVRVERKHAGTSTYLLVARENPRLAVELALTVLNADPDWRTTYANGAETTPQTLGLYGTGTLSWMLENSDLSLTDRDTELRFAVMARSPAQ